MISYKIRQKRQSIFVSTVSLYFVKVTKIHQRMVSFIQCISNVALWYQTYAFRCTILVVLEIAYLDPLAHLLQTFGQILHQIHLNGEGDGQIGVLVGGVDGPAHVEVNIRGFLKEQAADLGRAIVLEGPLLVAFVILQVVLSVLQHLVDGDNAFSDQIDAFDFRNGRHVGGLEFEGGFQGLVQILGRDGGRCAAADDVLALLGEEQRQHAVVVIPVRGRAEQQVHRHALADAHHAGRGVVAGLLAVKLVALVHQHGGKRLGRIAHGGQRFHKGDDVLQLPAKVIGHADARVRAAVAHGDKDIPLLELDDGLIDLFAADAHFGFGVIVVLVLAQHDDAGVIILDDLHPLVIDQVHDGEG